MPIAAFRRDHGANKLNTLLIFPKVSVGGGFGRRDLSAFLYCALYLNTTTTTTEDRYCWSQTCTLNKHSTFAFKVNLINIRFAIALTALQRNSYFRFIVFPAED